MMDRRTRWPQEKYASSLSKTSLDDKKAYSLLYDISVPVCNVDALKDDVCDLLRPQYPLHSCDALYVKKTNGLCLLEFKNQEQNKVKANQIRIKAFDSLALLNGSWYEDVSPLEFRRNVTLFVIYKGKSDSDFSFGAIKSGIKALTSLANEEPILFGLDAFVDFFHEIHTVTKEEFCSTYWTSVFGTPCPADV